MWRGKPSGMDFFAEEFFGFILEFCQHGTENLGVAGRWAAEEDIDSALQPHAKNTAHGPDIVQRFQRR